MLGRFKRQGPIDVSSMSTSPQPLDELVDVVDAVGEDVHPPLRPQTGPVRELQGGVRVVVEHSDVHPLHYAASR